MATDGTSPWWRPVAWLAGSAALGYGAWALLSGGTATSWPVATGWLAGVLVAHDAVVAPATIAAGWLLARAAAPLAPAACRVVAGGAMVAACLTLVALPALLAPGIDNPSATPRDYGRGLVLLLAADAVVTVALAAAVTVAAARNGVRRRPRTPPGTSR
jgi:hypothetical protein